jgi:uncharacterized protein (TIGR02598 family)
MKIPAPGIHPSQRFNDPFTSIRSRVFGPYGAGFSLIEVTLALSIAAIGFVVLLGLLPQGLEMARQASETSVVSKINRLMASELHATPWDRLPPGGFSEKRYFDDHGVETTANDAFGIYVASFYTPEPTLDVTVPCGDAVSTEREAYLRRVKICIAVNPTSDFEFSESIPSKISTQTVLLANLGN